MNQHLNTYQPTPTIQNPVTHKPMEGISIHTTVQKSIEREMGIKALVLNHVPDPDSGFPGVYLFLLRFEDKELGICIWREDDDYFIEEPGNLDNYDITIEKLFNQHPNLKPPNFKYHQKNWKLYIPEQGHWPIRGAQPSMSYPVVRKLALEQLGRKRLGAAWRVEIVTEEKLLN